MNIYLQNNDPLKTKSYSVTLFIYSEKILCFQNNLFNCSIYSILHLCYLRFIYITKLALLYMRNGYGPMDIKTHLIKTNLQNCIFFLKTNVPYYYPYRTDKYDAIAQVCRGETMG